MKAKNPKIRKSGKSRYPRFTDYFSPEKVRIMKVVALIALTVAMTGVVYFGGQVGSWFKASVLDMPMPFDGTVNPVAKVPNYTYWSTQKSLTFDQIPDSQLIDLPKYDLDKLQFANDKLVWGNASQDSIRNAKITYPVVYLGNYELDHIENVGSHLAVDIKMPIGTPVRAVANGKIVKVSNDSSGFGHHVVIKMINVPDPANPGSMTTLYACFNHMDRITVTEGENVVKGQLIGTSGNTGTSTTPHLHFQIDNDQAPWHPYWPFTTKEQTSAGLGFFDGVNAGLGISKARQYTVNPMAFVQNNLNYASSAVSTADTQTTAETTQTDTQAVSQESTVTETQAANTSAETQANTTEYTAPAADTATTAADDQSANTETVTTQSVDEADFTDAGVSNLFSYEMTGEKTAMIGSGITIYVRDDQNNILRLKDSDTITAELSGVGTLLKKNFTKSDFNNSVLKVVVRSDEVGIANVTVGKSSYQVQFIDQLKPISSFKIDTDGKYQKNIVETIKVIALDADGNVTPAVNFFGVANVTTGDDTVQLDPNQLSASDFKNGIAQIKMVVTSDNTVKIRVQNGALIGESQQITIEEKRIFKDVSLSNAHYEAIKYLKDNSIINGYSDGSFKPNDTVNRAEALKMLMGAFNITATEQTEISFKDVDKNAWYTQPLMSAVAKGIVEGYSDGTFKPDQTVNRAEYMKILLAANDIKVPSEITKPYSDVSLNDWFAGYAYQTNKMNLLDLDSSFSASKGMTRAEVAETIYRMMQIKLHNLVTYSK